MIAITGRSRKFGAHTGLDIRSDTGTLVLAPAPGWATTTWKSLGGLRVEIYHTSKYYPTLLQGYRVVTIVGHLSDSFVPRGDPNLKGDPDHSKWVKRGEAVGAVGNSGDGATHVPHLHFALYISPEKGTWYDVDPNYF